MTNLHPNLQKVIDIFEHSDEAIEACRKGVFYVVATPCMCTELNIGSMNDDLPALYPSFEAANEENQSCVETYLSEIEMEDRDEGDEWDGEVMKVSWDGGDLIQLFEVDAEVSENNVVLESPYKVLCGF